MCHSGILVLLQIKKDGSCSSSAEGKVLHTKSLEGIEGKLLLELVFTCLWDKRPLIHGREVPVVSEPLPETCLIPFLQHNLLRGKV